MEVAIIGILNNISYIHIQNQKLPINEHPLRSFQRERPRAVYWGMSIRETRGGLRITVE